MSEEPEGTEPEYTEEHWTYLGQSEHGHEWRDANGVRLIYKRLHAFVPGGIYTVNTLRDEQGNNVRVQRSMMMYEGKADDAGEIEVRARGWDVARRARQLEASAKRKTAIDATLDDLLELASKLISRSERQVLADYVTAKIMTARKGGGKP